MKKTDNKQHQNYSQSDYDYLKNKGYTDAEICEMWDRQAQPCFHKPLPVDIVAYLNGIH